MATLNPADTLDDSGDSIVDIDAALAAAADLSNDFFNHGDQIIVCSNASAGVRTLTVTGRRDPYGALVDNLVVAIPAGKIGMTSFLNPAMYNSGAKCTFTLDATATTKIGIIKLRKLR